MLRIAQNTAVATTTAATRTNMLCPFEWRKIAFIRFCMKTKQTDSGQIEKELYVSDVAADAVAVTYLCLYLTKKKKKQNGEA